jgi:hypothetical protein
MRIARPLALVAAGLAALILPASPSRAAGGATGSYGLAADTVFTVADAVAYRGRSWEGERIMVLLAGEPLDAAAWSAALDVAGVADRYKDESSYVELELQPDGTWAGTSFALRYDGGMSSGSSYESEFEGSMQAAVGAERVGGRLQAAFPDGARVDVTLDAPLLAPAGEALPDGGGEPAAAARACNAAFAARDLAAVRRACEADSGDIIDSAIRMRADGYEVEDPWTQAGASECDVAAVSGLAVEGGVTRGDEARLQASGGWSEERRCAGEVYLRREDGRWRVSRSAMALVSE